jgi:hypothetical protein
MVTETTTQRTPAELIAELDRLSAERLEVLREAGIEPFVERERSAEEQQRVGQAIYEWRKRRLETREKSEG